MPADAKPVRLARSLLVVPASRPEFFAKAAAGPADAVLIDLEDSVPAVDKVAARARAAEAIDAHDWGAKTVSLRVNGLATALTVGDITAVLERGAGRLDLVMLPKAESAADIRFLDTLVDQVERAAGRGRRLGLEAQIESARGLADVHEIAAASPRLEALHFGPGDFAASAGIRSTAIGGPVAGYGVLAADECTDARRFHPGDIWHYATSRLVVAARAEGLRAIDGPFAALGDGDGLAADARRGAVQGFDGKWAIHPTQVGAINAAFAPDPDEVARARHIVAALAEAADRGSGAVALDGRMIDMASIRQAEALIAVADRIAATAAQG
ncbi:MAG: CoA ester lyase [Alphaproteobacteria bacterium]